MVSSTTTPCRQRGRRGPVAQWSELAAHNRLVGGSSPPGPTTQPYANGDFSVHCEMPRTGEIRTRLFVSTSHPLDFGGCFGAFVSGRQYRVSRWRRPAACAGLALILYFTFVK